MAATCSKVAVEQEVGMWCTERSVVRTRSFVPRAVSMEALMQESDGRFPARGGGGRSKFRIENVHLAGSWCPFGLGLERVIERR